MVRTFFVAASRLSNLLTEPWPLDRVGTGTAILMEGHCNQPTYFETLTGQIGKFEQFINYNYKHRKYLSQSE